MDDRLAHIDDSYQTEPEGGSDPDVDEASQASNNRTSQHYAKCKADIISARRQMATAMWKIISSLKALEAAEAVSAPDLEDWLHADCGIPRDDLRIYTRFPAPLMKREETLVKHGISLTTLKKIVAADTTTRAVVLDHIDQGHPVDVQEIKTIQDDQRLRTESHEFQVQRQRSLMVRRAVHRAGRAIVSQFEAEASELHGLLVGFDVNYGLDPTDVTGCSLGYGLPQNREADLVAIRAKATTVLEKYHTLFDVREPVPVAKWLVENFPDDKPLRDSMCVESLRRISIGNLGRFVHFGPPPMKLPKEVASRRGKDFAYSTNTHALDPLEITAYLGGVKHRLGRNRNLGPRPRKTLAMLEICAGAGGQALGLMAAGFRPVALVEKYGNAVRTLRANWPKWDVRKLDLGKASTIKALQKFEGIDLLSGGLPCLPVTSLGRGKGLNDHRQLFDQALDLVGVVKPKAFLFENVLGMTGDNHSKLRSNFLKDLAKLGYSVSPFNIHGANWGLPQNRVRAIIVGIRKNSGAGHFTPPFHGRDHRTNFNETVLQLVVPFRTRPDLRGYRSQQQIDYDSWADWWVSEFGRERAATVTGLDKRTKATWAKVGFECDSVREKPVQVGEVTSSTMLAPLTIDLLKAFQGFPTEWKIAPDTSIRVQTSLIANAFPPILARIVGHKIHEALSGEKVLLDEAIDAEIVDVRRIGKRGLTIRPTNGFNDDQGEAVPSPVG